MSIATRRDEINQAIKRAELTHNLVGGTPAMQEGGYILKGSAEDPRDYEVRKKGAYLFNGYNRTRGYLTGQVFRKNIGISEESELKELFERMKHDIDLQGNNIRTFGQEFFMKGLDDGIRFLLVEYPTVETDGDRYWDEESESWLVRDAAVNKEKGWRPYFTQFGYDQVLGGRYEYINGVKTLTVLRLFEEITIKGDTDVDDEGIGQVRVFYPGKWETYRESEPGKGDWSLYEDGKTSLPVIPLAVWSPGDLLSDFTAVPALEDLAMLNKRHFVAIADQNVLMAFVRRPPWFGRNLVGDGESVAFGPGRMVHSTSPDASLASVGIDPASVEAGRGELKDLEERMSLYGLMMLTPTLRASGGKTATQAQQESAESVSQLTDWALGFKDCFDQALKFAAMFENMQPGSEPELTVNTDFQPGMGLTPEQIFMAVDKLLMSKEMAFDEFKRRGLYAEHWDWNDVKAMISDDQRTEIGPAGNLSGLAERLLALRTAGQGTPE